MSASGGYGAAKICAGIVGHVDLTPWPTRERGAGSPYPRRWRPVPRHSSHHRLRCRSDPDEPGLQPAARPDGRQIVPRGIRLPRTIEFNLRCVAVSSADRRRDCSGSVRSRAPVFASTISAVRWRSANMPANAMRFSRHGPNPSAISPPAPMSSSNWVAWRCGSTAGTSTRRPIRHRRKRLPPRGNPMSRPASKRSAQIAACSKAISRWTKDLTVTHRSGMRANCSPKARRAAEKTDLFSGTAARFYRLDL